MQVSLSDAPADQLLSFQLTINSIVLTSTSGATVGVLPAATTVEVSHLQATAQPLAQVAVPPGTYTGATVSLSNASATFVNLSAQTAEVNFSGTFNVPVSFNPNLVVGANAVALNLELNLAKSLPSPLPGTFTPVMTATSTNLPAINQQEEGTGAVHDLTGVVSSTGGNSFVMAVNQAATPFTIVVDGNTQFVGVSGLSGLAANTIVKVNAAMQADNTLLASKVEAEAGVKVQVEGVVFTFSPFTIIVQSSQNAPGANAFSLGVPLGITVQNTTTFVLPSDEANLSGLPFTAAFSSSSNVALGQRVEVRSSSDFSATAIEVKLALQTLSGTPNTQTGTNQYTLTLPSDSALHLLTGASSIDLIVQPTTEFKGLSGIFLSTPVHARGLLFFDTPSGRYKLVATRVTP